MNVGLNGIPEHAKRTPEGWAVFTDYHQSEPGYIPPAGETADAITEADLPAGDTPETDSPEGDEPGL